MTEHKINVKPKFGWYRKQSTNRKYTHYSLAFCGAFFNVKHFVN